MKKNTSDSVRLKLLFFAFTVNSILELQLNDKRKSVCVRKRGRERMKETQEKKIWKSFYVKIDSN